MVRNLCKGVSFVWLEWLTTLWRCQAQGEYSSLSWNIMSICDQFIPRPLHPTPLFSENQEQCWWVTINSSVSWGSETLHLGISRRHWKCCLKCLSSLDEDWPVAITQMKKQNCKIRERVCEETSPHSVSNGIVMSTRWVTAAVFHLPQWVSAFSKKLPHVGHQVTTQKFLKINFFL